MRRTGAPLPAYQHQRSSFALSPSFSVLLCSHIFCFVCRKLMKLIKNSPFVLLLAVFRYPAAEDFLWTLGFFMHIKVVRVININLQLGGPYKLAISSQRISQSQTYYSTTISDRSIPECWQRFNCDDARSGANSR